LLSHLVDKSLVYTEQDAMGDRRYRFLETVRQYARNRLLRSGEAGRVRDLHVDFFFALARSAEPELRRADQGSWLNRLQFDHDNLRSALEWSLAEPERAKRGLELAAALFWFWLKRGYVSEGRQWLERALVVGGKSSPRLRAKALIGLGHMTYFQGDITSTSVHLEESLTLGREADDQWAVAFALFMQALVALESGRSEEADQLALESQTAARPSGDLWLQSMHVFVLAYSAMLAGDYDRSSRLTEEALARIRQTGDKFVIGIGLGDLAVLRVLQGLYGEAREVAAEGILTCQEVGDRRGTAWCLEGLADAQAAQGQAVQAARLWGAVDELLTSIGVALPYSYKWVRDRHFESARASLGALAFETASSEGRAMSLTEAVHYALTETS
jgi:tetratricopeptide (TPR) repeat protein